MSLAEYKSSTVYAGLPGIPAVLFQADDIENALQVQSQARSCLDQAEIDALARAKGGIKILLQTKNHPFFRRLNHLLSSPSRYSYYIEIDRVFHWPDYDPKGIDELQIRDGNSHTLTIERPPTHNFLDSRIFSGSKPVNDWFEVKNNYWFGKIGLKVNVKPDEETSMRLHNYHIINLSVYESIKPFKF